MPTFTFTACTWNMQRGRTLTAGKSETQTKQNQRTSRLAGLRSICQNHDVVFIQEPGKDLREHLNTSPFGMTWHIDPREDNQSDSSACRSILAVNTGELTTVRLNFHSGAESASRYPAAAYWDVEDTNDYEHRILLVSLHATSGYGGGKNTQILTDVLDDYLDDNCPVLLVGADFNAESAQYQPVKKPNVPTHQSGSKLDGFYGDNKSVEQASDKYIELDTPVTVNNFTLRIGGNDKGCYHSGQRVSDHRPVEVTARIKWREKKRRRLI